ncbi:MAG: DUF1015 domain-containing protein [Ignavibacteriae bacterium]|nr:DUF1015 domain-containing protein [Ignavibacteriota bacterium]MCB9216077.1 DUF1015 domain-containing protein [Ignavibacteria bacterium]
MARIKAFNPFIYRQHHASDLSELIAPPYDVIKPEALQDLRNTHPHNITYLTLPEGDGDERYQTAGTLLRQWIEEGVLIQREAPALYPYSQTFIHPDTGDEITRIGIISLLQLEPFDKGIVLPHERTLKGPREDRLRLMEETEANLESIFGMFPDPEQTGLETLRSFVSQVEPMMEVADESGTVHRVWEVTDIDFIGRLSEQIDQVPVYIVDGHHRYVTALNYRDQWRAANPDVAEADLPVDHIMIYLTPMSDPGLVILPTHRYVHSLGNFNVQHLFEKLSTHFDLASVESFEEGFTLLAKSDKTAFLFGTTDRSMLAELKPGVSPADLVGNNIPPAVAELDVTILHSYIFDQLLGITVEAQELQKNLGYAKSQIDALKALEDEKTELVVGLNPTRFSQVERVANSSDVMPQKSTYFYPKLASGLTLNLLR